MCVEELVDSSEEVKAMRSVLVGMMLQLRSTGSLLHLAECSDRVDVLAERCMSVASSLVGMQRVALVFDKGTCSYCEGDRLTPASSPRHELGYGDIFVNSAWTSTRMTFTVRAPTSYTEHLYTRTSIYSTRNATVLDDTCDRISAADAAAAPGPDPIANIVPHSTASPETPFI